LALRSGGGHRAGLIVYRLLSRQHLFRRFLSNAAVYGASLLITRLGWILLLPVYWTRLTPEDYGIIGIGQLVSAFLGPVLGLGLHDSVQRFYLEWREEERRKHISALWSVSILWSGGICALLLAFGGYVSKHVFVQVAFDPYLVLSIGTAFFANLMLFPLAILRIRERVIGFSLITLGSFITQASITIVLVLVYELGAAGYLAGMFLNAVLWAAAGVALMRQEMLFPFKPRHAFEPLRYGLPLMPVAILDGAAGVFDRYFLDKYVRLSTLGLYNLGNQFGSAFNLFNQMLKSSWLPFLYRVVSERDDGPSILSRFGVYYLALLVFPALGVALLSRELIALLGDPRFYGVYEFVPPFVLIYYIQSIAAAMGRGMDLAKRTAMWPVVPIVAILTSITALSVLVPKWGVYGALTALGIAACVRVFLQVGISMYYYPRPLLIGTLLKIWAIAFTAFFVGYHSEFSSLWVNACAKLGAIGLAMAAIMRIALGRAAFAALWRSGRWRFS
jgi:O-antigen/teichoic acid export membrane protein